MSYSNLGAIPVYKKALELREISSALGSYISFSKDNVRLCTSNSLRDNIIDLLLTDSTAIPEQIAEAEKSQSYAQQLKSVNLITIMVRNINSYCTGLEKDGVQEKEYLNLLRNELSSFRESFKKWKDQDAFE